MMSLPYSPLPVCVAPWRRSQCRLHNIKSTHRKYSRGNQQQEIPKVPYQPTNILHLPMKYKYREPFDSRWHPALLRMQSPRIRLWQPARFQKVKTMLQKASQCFCGGCSWLIIISNSHSQDQRRKQPMAICCVLKVASHWSIYIVSSESLKSVDFILVQNNLWLYYPGE